MSVQASKADTPLVQGGQGWRVAQAIWWRVEPVVRSSAAIVLFLLLWELAPRFGLINRTFLPPFSEVVVKGVQYAAAGKLLNGVRQADPALVKYARSVGLPDWRIFTKVVLPSAAPSIITGMRLAATYSFLMLVVSEMVGASSGLGYLIVNAQYLLSVHLLYVGVIVLALLGIASNWALVALEQRLGAWRPDLQP